MSHAERIVVAMSGGVDSSVVAASLARDGYDVVGITLQLYDHGAALAKKGACCAGRDIHDARRVAAEMGFPHYVLDYENRFREAVIEEFADQYLAVFQILRIRRLLLGQPDENLFGQRGGIKGEGGWQRVLVAALVATAAAAASGTFRRGFA